MADIKKLELTEDPLTNICLMVPVLDNRACEAVSYFMYGCCVGESIAKDGYRDKPETAIKTPRRRRHTNRDR